MTIALLSTCTVPLSKSEIEGNLSGRGSPVVSAGTTVVWGHHPGGVITLAVGCLGLPWPVRAPNIIECARYHWHSRTLDDSDVASRTSHNLFYISLPLKTSDLILKSLPTVWTEGSQYCPRLFRAAGHAFAEYTCVHLHLLPRHHARTSSGESHQLILSSGLLVRTSLGERRRPILTN